MRSGNPDALMRIFLDKGRPSHHQPLYEHLVLLARKRGLAGATVFEGIEGFGQRGRILQDTGMWHLAGDAEVVVEIVDERPRLDAFLLEIEPILLPDAIVTLEKARVEVWRDRKEKPRS